MTINGDTDTIRVLERVTRAIELRRTTDMTWDQIATEVGYASKGACYAAVMGYLRRTFNSNRQQLIEQENLKISLIQDALTPKVETGDPAAANAFLRSMKRFADMNGLDAPKQVQVSAGVAAQLDEAFQGLRLVVQGSVVPDPEPETPEAAGSLGIDAVR